MARPTRSSGDARSTSSHIAIATLALLIEDTFERDLEHSLLANLHSLRDEDWTIPPSGGGRSVADILEHAAWCKWMYEDDAFGSAALRGD